MRLSDIMSNLELSIYPQVGLVIFLAIFGCVLYQVFSGSQRREFDRAATLPLEDDAAVPQSPISTGDNRE